MMGEEKASDDNDMDVDDRDVRMIMIGMCG